jgi:hypothetical protein
MSMVSQRQELGEKMHERRDARDKEGLRDKDSSLSQELTQGPTRAT